MYFAFFDDSGTHENSPIVAIGGVMGTEAQLEPFEKEWKCLLGRPFPDKPPLRQFHLTACRNGQDEFIDYSRADRDRINFLFRELIVKYRLYTIASCIDRSAWNELVVGDIQDVLGKPEEFCFVRCVDAAIELARRGADRRVEFAFDAGVRSIFQQWAHLYEQQKAKYPEITGFGFAKVERLPPLQGADMVATETYYYAQRWLADGPGAAPNPHFRPFLARAESHGSILDRDSIRPMVEGVKRQLAAKEKRLRRARARSAAAARGPKPRGDR
jgi:hypothetical protein